MDRAARALIGSRPFPLSVRWGKALWHGELVFTEKGPAGTLWADRRSLRVRGDVHEWRVTGAGAFAEPDKIVFRLPDYQGRPVRLTCRFRDSHVTGAEVTCPELIAAPVEVSADELLQTIAAEVRRQHESA
ncbi:hypothetical protein [Actinoplanes friuliensis]|uniref:Uncharacterized protein n=1 Tax=Actinoplanes friuliensis DSM 7358 TaxID=1246995 RepID=U5W3U9_9ACTN|nr:hypothetical protein [Actinoplanes friuliensis]AGZ43893.1 hypothetical protein AFR_28160 [Actinoplanes friuliensis DSM 7358]